MGVFLKTEPRVESAIDAVNPRKPKLAFYWGTQVMTNLKPNGSCVLKYLMVHKC